MATVRGRSEVKAHIASLPAKLTPVLRGAARAGGNVIADEIKANTPSDEVREAVRIRSKAGDGQIRVTIDLKPGWGRSVGTWLEYGTSPHFISVDQSHRNGMSIGRMNQLAKESNHSLVIGGKFVGQTVLHPGARPHPTFRPALDQKEGAAIQAAQAYINSRVTRGGILPGPEGEAE